ncbi:MAG: ABC transporter ATP-binding protein [Pelagibacteraceae bacterium]
MNKNILEIINVNKSYKHKNGEVKIFSNISLSIKKGELIALVGPSGSGKSSLLNMISFLDLPDSGEIIFQDKKLSGLSEYDKNYFRINKISLVFQNNNLLNDFTAEENVALPLIIKNEKKDKAIKYAQKILKEFNLSNRNLHFPDELSGGEQQRVAIARCLIAGTDLILADEPTGNLDYNTSQEVFSYFLKLKKLNKTIIFATHNRELANKADYKLSISNCDIKRTDV